MWPGRRTTGPCDLTDVSGQRRVHLLFPAGYDDPARASGGNVYDHRLRDGLEAEGWTVVDQQVSGAWPVAESSIDAAVEEQLSRVPDGTLVLFDGLLGVATTPLLKHARRVRLVALVHMPGPPGGPPAVLLGASRLVITTSAWTASQLAERSATAVVARPGVARAGLATGTPGGGSLLCVGSVVPAKGYDVLVAALAQLAERDTAGRAPAWTCTCVGARDRDPGFAGHLLQVAADRGLDDRLLFTGVLGGAELDRVYDRTDLLVLPTRLDSYGMVVTEALARGVPVLASAVGGVPEALGHAPDGTRPGVLVPPGDVQALSTAVSQWLTDIDQRERLRASARARRSTLTGWDETARTVSDALARLDHS